MESGGLDLADPDVKLAVDALDAMRGESTPGSPNGASGANILEKVQSYPLISSALSAYNAHKTRSRPFRYGAEMVESVAGGIVRRITPSGPSDAARMGADNADAAKMQGVEEYEFADVTKKQIVYQGGAWQSVLTGAGGLGVAFSEESATKLRVCLHWLRHANLHLAELIANLDSLLTQALPSQKRSMQANGGTDRAVVRFDEVQSRINALKQEVITTIKRIVSVVSSYAGSALPYPARSRVRAYILSLPSRFAHHGINTPSTPNDLSDETNRMSRTEHAAERVLVLAKETLYTIGNVISIVNDTLQSGDAWLATFGGQPHEDVKME